MPGTPTKGTAYTQRNIKKLQNKSNVAKKTKGKGK